MITNKVLDSVKQISDYADVLIANAADLQNTDVLIASTELERSVKKLVELFDKSPDARTELLTLKNEVDKKALLLERLIAIRKGTFRDKIALREFSQTLYEDVTRRLKELTEMKDLSNSTIVEWTSYIPFVIRLSVCSKQTCFVLDAEDEAMIKKITKSMCLDTNKQEEE